MTEKLHVIPHGHHIDKQQRENLNKHRSLVVWFTGLSGSGKSSLANSLEQYLFSKSYRTYILDGDNIRTGLNNDLNFSDESRKENIRRIGEVAKLMSDAGLIVLSAFVSPFKEDRNHVKAIVGENEFIEVFVDCSLEVCEQRDVKGLYKKARKGEISNFTGISSPFEVPEKPDVHIYSDKETLEESLHKLITYIEPKLKFNNE